jgi:antitoxin StbD
VILALKKTAAFWGCGFFLSLRSALTAIRAGNFMSDLDAATSIDLDELRVDAAGITDRAKGPIALVRLTEPIAYLVPAREWEAVVERLEYIELADLVTSRVGEKTMQVELADL